MSVKQSTGVYFDDEMLDEIKANMERADCRSRSEFVKKAVRFYLSYLETANNGSTLFPILDEALDGRMRDTENRLSRVLFKLGVEIAMMMHVVAATNEIDEEQLEGLRQLCQDEVARLSGRYRFDDAVRFQR